MSKAEDHQQSHPLPEQESGEETQLDRIENLLRELLSITSKLWRADTE